VKSYAFASISLTRIPHDTMDPPNSGMSCRALNKHYTLEALDEANVCKLVKAYTR